MLEILSITSIFILFYILILKNFKLGLSVLLILSVLLHKELFSFYRWDLMPIRAAMLAVFAAGITKMLYLVVSNRSLKPLLTQVKDSLKEPFVLLLALLWFVRGISIIFTQNLQASILLFGFFTTVVALGIWLFKHFKSEEDKSYHISESAHTSESASVTYFLKLYIFIAFGLAIFGLIQLLLFYKFNIVTGAFWYIPDNLPRVGSLFWDVNHYGAFIAALLPISCVLVLTEKTWKRSFLFAVIAIFLVAALLLTNSRTAWMIDFFALLSFIALLFFRKFGMKGLGYVIIGLVLITTPLLIEYSDKSSPFRARIKQYFHYRIDSFDSHMMLLTGSIQVFEKYPILGGGYGGFFEHFSQTEIAPTYFGRDPAGLNTRVPAHTIWGELVSETGVIGLSVFVLFSALMLLSLLFIVFRSKNLKTVLMSSVLASVYVGWMIAGIFYSYNTEFFWLLIFFFFIWAYQTFVSEFGPFEPGKILGNFVTSDRFLISILTALSVGLIFFNLGSTALIPWDEAIYAKIAKNMVISGEYVEMTWDGIDIWYEKPPLYIWLMAGFMNILGINEWAARLPSALAGFGTILLVYFLGRKLFNKTVGFIAGFVLMTTVHFLYYSRASMIDVTATFFITAALTFYYMTIKRNRFCCWTFTGAFIGLAVMTKGVIGLLPFPIIALTEYYLLIVKERKLNFELVKNWLLVVFMFFVIALPWHMEMYFRFGQSFIDNYFGYHVIARATEAIEDKGKPFLWYVIVMKVSMRLWFIALLGALPLAFYKSFKHDVRFVYLLNWVGFTFLLFSYAESKLIWYIIPIYPAVSLLVAHFGERVLDWVLSKFFKHKLILAKGLLLFIFLVGALTYLFYVRDLVYPGDLTGSQAYLLKRKDEHFGTKSKVFVDRIDLPVTRFYTDSPFEIIDFRPDLVERVPVVPDHEELILLTKKGRFSEEVVGYSYGPKVVEERGDWILWYFESREDRLQEMLDMGGSGGSGGSDHL